MKNYSEMIADLEVRKEGAFKRAGALKGTRAGDEAEHMFNIIEYAIERMFEEAAEELEELEAAVDNFCAERPGR